VIECPHSDVRRSRVARDGVLMVLCPKCVEGWEGPSVGPPPTAFDPPQVDDASLREEYHHLRLAKLLVEHCEAELDAARTYLRNEMLRIRREYGTTHHQVAAQLGMSRSSAELYVRYQPGQGYLFTAKKEALKRQMETDKKAFQRAKRKARAVRTTTFALQSDHAKSAESPDRSADGSVQHSDQRAPRSGG
jgi:hypothetical protein